MKEKQITISCQVFESMEQLDARDRALCEAAMEARKSSYALYSGFNVGAAVLLEGGITVKGSNQENAAFPSSLCAERTAMYSASANYPGKAMLGIAIVDEHYRQACDSLRRLPSGDGRVREAFRSPYVHTAHRQG